MDGSTTCKGTTCEGNVEKAAALKSCLVYLLQDAKGADLGWCALHLKIASSELNSIMDKGARETRGSAPVSLCGHPAISREIAN